MQVDNISGFYSWVNNVSSIHLGNQILDNVIHHLGRPAFFRVGLLSGSRHQQLKVDIGHTTGEVFVALKNAILNELLFSLFDPEKGLVVDSGEIYWNRHTSPSGITDKGPGYILLGIAWGGVYTRGEIASLLNTPYVYAIFQYRPDSVVVDVSDLSVSFCRGNLKATMTYQVMVVE